MKLKIKNLELGTKNGFTLVELLLVITIIAVLFAVMVSVINPVRKAKLARDVVRKQDLQVLSRAIEAYYTDNLRNLPATGETHLSTDGSPPQNSVGAGWIPANLSLQLKTLPNDTINSGQYFYRYYGESTPGSARFKLDASLEADTKASQNDGGVDPARFEVGTDKSLLPP